jgi:hypothetical protein
MPDQILTPPTIATLPRGLLRYLQIQSGGRYPQSVGETIAPILDMIEMMVASTDVTAADTLSLNATGTVLSTTLLVADTKVVRCSMIGLRVATVAAEAIKLGIIVRSQNGGTLTLSPTVTLAASTGDQVPVTTVPVWLLPGDNLGVQVYSITTAGNISANLHIRKSDFFF